MRGLLYSIKTRLFTWTLLFRHPELRQAYAIHSHLTSHERHKLFQLAQGKAKILEIGSYVGASAACFGASKANGHAGAIYCIDTWQNDAMTEGNRDTYSEFMKNTKAFEEWIVPIRGYSTEVLARVKEHTQALDVLFIDGDHSYEGVKADWDAYKDFLSAGSIVIFHDWGWAEGVKQVIEQDVKPVVSDFESLPNMWWGTIRSIR